MINLGSRTPKYISQSGDQDFYTFVANVTGQLNVSLVMSSKDYNLDIFDVDGHKLTVIHVVQGNTEIAYVPVDKDKRYYILISGANSNEFSENEAYILDVGHIQIDDHEPLNNNFTNPTGLIIGGGGYSSYISVKGDEDWYRIDAGSYSGKVKVQMSVPTSLDYDIQVYRADNTQLKRNNNDKGIAEDFTFTVEANASYYLKVYGYNNLSFGSDPYVLTVQTFLP